jgi:hypothetical protein
MRESKYQYSWQRKRSKKHSHSALLKLTVLPQSDGNYGDLVANFLAWYQSFNMRSEARASQKSKDIRPRMETSHEYSE